MSHFIVNGIAATGILKYFNEHTDTCSSGLNPQENELTHLIKPLQLGSPVVKKKRSVRRWTALMFLTIISNFFYEILTASICQLFLQLHVDFNYFFSKNTLYAAIGYRSEQHFLMLFPLVVKKLSLTKHKIQ